MQCIRKDFQSRRYFVKYLDCLRKSSWGASVGHIGSVDRSSDWQPGDHRDISLAPSASQTKQGAHFDQKNMVCWTVHYLTIPFDGFLLTSKDLIPWDPRKGLILLFETDLLCPDVTLGIFHTFLFPQIPVFYPGSCQ